MLRSGISFRVRHGSRGAKRAMPRERLRRQRGIRMGSQWAIEELNLGPHAYQAHLSHWYSGTSKHTCPPYANNLLSYRAPRALPARFTRASCTRPLILGTANGHDQTAVSTPLQRPDVAAGARSRPPNSNIDCRLVEELNAKPDNPVPSASWCSSIRSIRRAIQTETTSESIRTHCDPLASWRLARCTGGAQARSPTVR